MINRKKLIYVSILVLLAVVIITIGTIVIFNLLGNNKPSNSGADTTQKSNTTTVVSADTLKQQAIDASKNNDYVKAKTLLQEARKQYEAIGDTDKVVDIDAQLYYINHKPDPPEAPVMAPITVEVAQ